MNWNQLKGNVTEQWIWFSGAQLDMVEGNQTHFYGSIQKSYTLTSAESNKRLSDWQNQ
ncbi:MAG: hypothetical protein NTV43_17565 [Methylococcales bacterium]|nr:hypothetical protein [Methylococcales bacterium]